MSHLLLLALAAAAPSPRTTLSSIETPTRAAYLALASEAAAQALSKAPEKQKRALSAILEKLRDEPARGQASLGALTGALGRPRLGTVLAGRAAQAAPDDALVANNLGALLRSTDQPLPSARVLLYARRLDPKSPLVLTNLAGTAFELGDPAAAERLYLEALSHDEHHCEALRAMYLLRVKQNRLSEAREWLFKSVPCMNAAAVRRKIRDQATSDPPEEPVPPPPEPGGDGSRRGAPAADDGRSGVPGPTVRFPEIPAWPDVASFLSWVPAGQRWEKAIQAQTDRAAAEAEAAERALAAATPGARRPGDYALTDEPSVIALEIDLEWFGRASGKVQADYLRKTKSLDDWAARELENLTREEEAILKGGLPGLEEKARALCKRRMDFVERHFGGWRNAMRAYHRDLERLAEKYRKASDSFLARVQDRNQRKLAAARRKLAILSTLAPLTMETLLGRPLLFAGETITTLPACSWEPPQAAEAPGEPTIPEKEGPPCLTERPHHFKVLVAELNLDCDKIGVEFGEGLIVGFEGNFHKRTVTVFVGAGVKLGGAGLGPVEVGLDAKAGAFIEFEPVSGEIHDVGGKAALEAELTVHDWGMKGQREISLGLESGLQVEE